MTALLALADSLPPAAMAGFPQSVPISTMTWALDVMEAPSDMDGWHLLMSESDHSLNGYSMQSMSLWDAQGKHLAIGRQVVAIFI
ncbi:MAG: thioesterase family protein [Sphingosinicella sp.]|nr:thioesterase family protein [Sphingosinicella sp.]